MQSLHHVFHCCDGAHLEESAKDEHVEHLRIACTCSLFHGVNAIDIDVVALGWLNDGVSIVDDGAAWLHLWLELLQRGLVEHDGCVVGTDDRGADHLVTHNDSHIGSTATLFRAVGRHPTHVLVFHNAGIGKNLTH